MKREASTRITLAIILIALLFTVTDYPWAFGFVALVAAYSLVTGLFKLKNDNSK